MSFEVREVEVTGVSDASVLASLIDDKIEADDTCLSIGFAMSEVLLPEDIGRPAMVAKVAEGVERAKAEAGSPTWPTSTACRPGPRCWCRRPSPTRTSGARRSSVRTRGTRWAVSDGTTGLGIAYALGEIDAVPAGEEICKTTALDSSGTGGMGGFAMAAAPAIVRFVGLQAASALGEHPHSQMPIHGFRGTPVGIDATRIVRTGIVPAVSTGIAGKGPGTGQVSAGPVTSLMEVFTAAVRALAEGAEAP